MKPFKIKEYEDSRVTQEEKAELTQDEWGELKGWLKPTFSDELMAACMGYIDAEFNNEGLSQRRFEIFLAAISQYREMKT